ncbi:MAG: orotidine 5'-phosphate decarboxylase [Desulfurococcales archaeon]|nr:orotidine 5'-phosphate decarboxylase [Desulfurococcales archaeon]
MSLIVALDPPRGVDPFKWSVNLIESIGNKPAGVKVGIPLTVRVGVEGLKDILSVSPHKLRIADMKLADIGYVMSLITEAIAETGVNAVIAHAFVGREGALENLKRTCDELGVKLVVLGLMSHPGASEIMRPVFRNLLGVIKDLKPWGSVLPATMPEAIREGREFLGKDVKILSPGVGAQGASPGDALCAGADYEIVGRLITRAEDPSLAVEEVIKAQRERVEACLGS